MARDGWDRLKRTARQEAGMNLAVASYYFRDRVKERISVGAPPSSAPREPPPVRTGRLRNSIAAEIDLGVLKSRIGTNLEYGPHLECGTSRMAARPFLRPTLLIEMPNIIRIMGGR